MHPVVLDIALFSSPDSWVLGLKLDRKHVIPKVRERRSYGASAILHSISAEIGDGLQLQSVVWRAYVLLNSAFPSPHISNGLFALSI